MTPMPCSLRLCETEKFKRRMPSHQTAAPSCPLPPWGRAGVGASLATPAQLQRHALTPALSQREREKERYPRSSPDRVKGETPRPIEEREQEKLPLPSGERVGVRGNA